MDLVDYAKCFIGKPYLWGGRGVVGFDCSGLVLECLKFAGLRFLGDLTADGILNIMRKYSDIGETPSRNALLFFGDVKVSHVAIAIDEKTMIEAGGGNSKTVTMGVAEAQGAMVRIRPINSRRDLIEILHPVFHNE